MLHFAQFYRSVARVQLTISINTVSPDVSALFARLIAWGVVMFYWHQSHVPLCALRHFPSSECYCKGVLSPRNISSKTGVGAIKEICKQVDLLTEG